MGPAEAGITTSQMQANLTGAKEARKRAEKDAQLLANRIALLKQEEEKALKKIDETHKRAAEVTQLRSRNEQKHEAKEQLYKDKWTSIRVAQQNNELNRDKSKAMREATRQELLKQKLHSAERTKQQSNEILLAKKDRENHER